MLSVILVAAGSGKRMQSDIPKQFIKLHEQSILEHTFNSFKFLTEEKEFIIVLNPDYFDEVKPLLERNKNEKVKLVSGGQERFHSVQNALNKLDQHSKIVLIHDGVRPFATQKMIIEGIESCRKNGCAIPAISLNDTIRKVSEENLTEHLNRENYRLIQTPQIFKSTLICEAYSAKYNGNFTDDASVFEANGGVITLYQGDNNNIKITRKEDLNYAKFLLDK